MAIKTYEQVIGNNAPKSGIKTYEDVVRKPITQTTQQGGIFDAPTGLTGNRQAAYDRMNNFLPGFLKPVSNALANVTQRFDDSKTGKWINRGSESANTVMLGAQFDNPTTTGSKIGDVSADIFGGAVGFMSPGGMGSASMATSNALKMPQFASKVTGKITNPALSNIARGAIENAGVGAIYGVTEGIVNDRTPGEIAKNIAIDAAIGTGIGAGLEGAKMGLGKIKSWRNWTQDNISRTEPIKGEGFTVEDAPVIGVNRTSLEEPKQVDGGISDIYNNIVTDLDGVGTAPDENIAKIAKEVSGNATPIRYNMTDIYRTLRNSFGKHIDYVKQTYLDPFDYSKGEYAKSIKKESDELYNDVVQRLGIQKGSKESAAVQWFGEGKRLVEIRDPQTGAKKLGESVYTIRELQKEFPQSWQKIVEADQWFKKRYNDYVDGINATLKKIYPYVETEVEKLRATQADLRNQKSKVLKDNNLSDEAKKSASDLLTEQIRTANQKINDMLLNRRLPKRNDYYRHFREMGNSFQTLENLLGTSAQIDPRLVGVSDTTLPKSRWASFMQRRGQGYYDADAVGGFLDYIKPANYKIHIEQHIPKFRQLAKDLAENTAESKNANNLIEHLQLFANDLAGKTNEFDRPLQKTVLGRKAMGIINWVNSRVMANAVLGNARSVISQTANLPMGMSRLKDPRLIAKSAGQMLTSLVEPSSSIKKAFQESSFLSERYLDSAFSKFDNKILDQPEKFAAWAMRSTDELATKWIWATAYNKAIKQGVPNSIKWADDFTRSIVAGRGIGEMPLAQKSLMGRLFIPFQVEVGNMWHVFGDALKEKDYAGLAIMPVALWLFNEGYRQIFGSDVAFNPIGALQDALNEEDITPGKVAGRLAGEVISNLPGGQTIATIVPENMRQQYFGRNDPTRFGTGGANVLKPLTNAASDITKGDLVGAGLDLANYVMPFGAGQLKKTVEGTQAIAKGGSYMNNGQLRFPIAQTPSNAVKGSLFGQYATPEAREYFDQNRRPLGEKQTKAYQQSSNREALYRQILRDRELQNINDKISQLNKDTKMTPEEKRREYQKLNERRKKLRGA